MSYQPRQYQAEAIGSIINKLEVGRSTLAVLSTGAGKTVIAAHVADHFVKIGRVLVLAHRDELIRQAAEKFHAVTGHEPDIEKGDEWADTEPGLHGETSRIIVSSFQTQNSGRDKRRMHRFNPMEFSLIWIDECHHCLAPTFRAVIDYYQQGNPSIKVLGVTATPDRGDDEPLGQVFQTVAYRYELDRAILDGYLVPVRQHAVRLEGLDFSQCRTTAGDLNGEDLNLAMMAEKPLHGLVHATIEAACELEQGTLKRLRDDPARVEKLAALIAGRPILPTLVFTVGVPHAQKTAEILNRWIPNSADYVAGAGGEFGMDMEERRSRLKSFHEGRFPFIVNCDVCGEGWDESIIRIVAMGRPTKSRARYTQNAGRGTRPLEEIAHMLGTLPDAASRVAAIKASGKPSVLILDFCGNAGKHKLITMNDILGGAYPPEVSERAAQIAEEGAIDVQDALERAANEMAEEQRPKQEEAEDLFAQMEREELERCRREMAARRNGIVATSEYTVEEVSTFEESHRSEPERVTVGGASGPQIDLLVKLGVKRETAAGYGMRQAGVVISSLKLKRCTTGQANYLRTLGYRGEPLNFEQASAKINELRDAPGKGVMRYA